MDQMASVLRAFDAYEEISHESAFMEGEPQMQALNSQMQSNMMDKGQFVQNSCMSI